MKRIFVVMIGMTLLLTGCTFSASAGDEHAAAQKTGNIYKVLSSQHEKIKTGAGSVDIVTEILMDRSTHVEYIRTVSKEIDAGNISISMVPRSSGNDARRIQTSD